MGSFGPIQVGPGISVNLSDIGVNIQLSEEFTQKYGNSLNPIWMSGDYDLNESSLTLIIMETHHGSMKILDYQTIGLS